ncbi:MAG TPA: hypothetical protein VF482_19615 [Trebonia sp.]
MRPADGTLVIYHSVVLAYLTEPQPRQFAELTQTLDAVWISNEVPGVLPGTAFPTSPGCPPVANASCLSRAARR